MPHWPDWRPRTDHHAARIMPRSILVLLLEPRESDGSRLGPRISGFEKFKANVVTCTTLAEAEAELARSLTDLVLVDSAALDIPLADAVMALKARAPQTALVAVSDDENDALAVIKAGAEDWLPRAEPGCTSLGCRLQLALARHDSERGLREREQELRSLVDHNPSPVLVYRQDNLKFLVANEAAARFYGYSREQLLEMTMEDIRHPEDAPKMRELVARGIPEHFHAGVWRHRTHDGLTVFVDITMHALLFQGVPARMSQVRDVTMERRAQQALEASEKRFRDIFEHSLGFICTHDMEGQLLSINPAAAEALGYRIGELLGTSLRALMPEDMQDRFDIYLDKLRADSEAAGVLTLVHRDGSQRAWQYHNRLFDDGSSEAVVMGYAQDITALMATEQALRRSEQQIRTITDALPLRVAFVDTALRYAFVNAQFERVHGRRRHEIIGSFIADVIGKEAYERRRERIDRALKGKRQQFEDETGSGPSYRCEEITYLPEYDSKTHDALGMHIMVQDVTDRKLKEHHLIKLAQVDGLTGLLNRSGFTARLDRAIERARDQHAPMALLYLDLDRFKPVNDEHGHAAGDLLLKAFAKRLRANLRSSDVPARLGGDEFAVLMEGVPDQAPAIATAERILAAVTEPFVLRDQAGTTTAHIGVSIGLVMRPGASHETAGALGKRADAALYEAKHGGRGTWRMG